jgi:hypothetical protein
MGHIQDDELSRQIFEAAQIQELSAGGGAPAQAALALLRRFSQAGSARR